MVKKFICPICGYVHEGTEAPERCPQCKQIVEWKVASDDKLSFACEHILGVAKDEKDPIIAEGLRAHFIGECTEVGQYLAMARQADREGYPEVAEAFRRYAGACEDKLNIAKRAKELNLDPIHDTVHEMARDEARHGKGFEGLYKRYFSK